jgi:hypothetical protein
MRDDEDAPSFDGNATAFNLILTEDYDDDELSESGALDRMTSMD